MAFLQEEAMADVVVGDVVSQHDAMTAVNGVTSAERVANHVVGHDRGDPVSGRVDRHVEVDGVSADYFGLAHVKELGSADVV